MSGKPSIVDEWGNFVTIPLDFIKQSKKLSDGARWLFVLLREYTNGESGKAFPSYDTIKERTGWGYCKISKSLKDLEKNGWLEREYQFGGVTNYTLKRPAKPDQSYQNERIAQSFQNERSILPKRKGIKNESTKIDLSNSLAKPHELLVVNDLSEPETSCKPPSRMLGLVGDSKIVGDDFPEKELATRYDPSLTKLEIVQYVVIDDQTPPTPSQDPSPTPKKPATRRKSQKTASSETGNGDHQALMAYMHERMGRIQNKGGEAKAVKEMLAAGYGVERIKAELETQLAQLLAKRRNVVNWMTVKQSIASSVFAETQKQTTGGTSNGTTATNEPTGEFNLYEFIRKTTGNVGYGSKLLGTDQRSITG